MEEQSNAENSNEAQAYQSPMKSSIDTPMSSKRLNNPNPLSHQKIGFEQPPVVEHEASEIHDLDIYNALT